MLRRLALAASLALALAGPAAAQRAGLYSLSGTNPDGSAYEGVVALQQVGLVSWRVVWDIQGDRIEGIGMSNGNIFAVTYQINNRPGIGIFSVEADGSMSGQWTIIGSGGIGTETLRPR